MTVLQSYAGRGLETPPTSRESGERMAGLFSFTFDKLAYNTATDQIELGVLPADAQIIGAHVIGENLGAITANVGIMTGTLGDPTVVRTVGTELFAAQSVNNAEAAATKLACLAIARSPNHRALGATLSGNVAIAANKKITLLIEYIF